MGSSLQEQITSMRQSLFDEEILSDEFKVIESLTDDSNPDFMEDAVGTYFEQVNELIITVEEEMDDTMIAYKKLDIALFKLKGSSATIGANKVKNEATQILECFRLKDLDGAKAALEKLKTEKETLKTKLDTYFELLKQLNLDSGSDSNPTPDPSTSPQ